MPIPKPKNGEDRDTFVSRCISTVKDEDPNRPHKQIIAICFESWRRKDMSKKPNASKVKKLDSKNKRFTVTSRQLGNEKSLVIYMENDEGYCEGWVFESIKVAHKNKLTLGSRVKKLTRAPREMLDFDGVIPIGKPGASRNYVGIYKILERGTYQQIDTEEKGYYKYRFFGKKLLGNYVVKRLEDKELIETSKYQYLFDKSQESLQDELLKQMLSLTKKGRTVEKLQYNSLKIVSNLKEGGPLIIRGTALKEGVWNGLYYPKSEIMNSAILLQGKPLMIDHSGSVRDIVGRVTRSWYELGAVLFEAEVLDELIAKKIIEGLIDSVSVGVVVDRFEEHGRLVARNYTYKELSLVLIPAVDAAKITEVISS